MVVTYVAAIAVASVAVRGAIRHPKLAFWRRWDAVALQVRVIPMYAFGPLVATLVTATLSSLIEKAPDGAGWDVVMGVGCGSLTLLLLRPEVASRGRAPVAPARALFATVLNLTSEGLDQAAAKAVRRKLGGLDTPTLCRVTTDVFRDHVEPRLEPDVAAATEAHLITQQERALEGNRGPEQSGIDATTHIDARARLQHWTSVSILATNAITVDLVDEPARQLAS